jgi:hypothetical protein
MGERASIPRRITPIRNLSSGTGSALAIIANTSAIALAKIQANRLLDDAGRK